jgi:hypothetical protein
MDWTDLTKKLIALGLPVLGTALGGPFGGAIAAIIARAIGAPGTDPGSIAMTIDGMAPEVAIQKLKSAEAETVAAINAQAEVSKVSATEVGATMRAELIGGSEEVGWWGIFSRAWRPLFAYELLAECTCMAVVFAHEVWTGDFQTLTAIMQFQGFLTWYYAMRFGVIGVFGIGRSQEKVAAIKATTSGGNGDPDQSLIEKVAGKVAAMLGR